MNSIMRQNNIKSGDLHGYLSTYDANNTTAVSIWAKKVCTGFKPGTLLFIVEPANLPFGLISFVRKEEEENYRVVEFALVVRMEDDKPMAVIANNNNYELRFLEALLEEKARKAVIDRKKFSFVAAKPITPLVGSALKELERLAGIYAIGGARRSFMADGSVADNEPTMALLMACGVHMHNAGAATKQPLDISVICHSLYASDIKPPDNNRSQLVSAFTPLPGDAKTIDSSTGNNESLQSEDSKKSLTKNDPTILPTPRAQDATGFNLLQSWGGEKSKGSGVSPLTSRLKEEADKGQKVSVAGQIHQALNLNQGVPESWSKQEVSDEPVQDSVKTPPDSLEKTSVTSPPAKPEQDEEVYRHLTEAITGLLGTSNEAAKQNNLDVAKETSEPSELSKAEKTDIDSKGNSPEHRDDKRRWPAAKSFEKLPAFTNPLTLPANLAKTSEKKTSSPSLPAIEPAELTVNIEAVPIDEAPQVKSVSEVISQADLTPLPEVAIGATSPPDLSLPLIDELIQSSMPEPNIAFEQQDLSDALEAKDLFVSSEMTPDKLDDFQEPKVVMNEMASLMSKLETQVARASKKLAIKASEIEQRLNTNLDTLLNLVIQEDKDAYAELLIRSDALIRDFELLFDKLKTELAEKAANCREQIKETLVQNQDKIVDGGKALRELLLEEFKNYQTQFNQLIDNQETILNTLINQQNQILHERLEAIDNALEDTSIKLDGKLTHYFANFKDQIEEKVFSLSKSFDDHIGVIGKDIDVARAENIEKLKLAKEDFFHSLDRLIKVTEIALSRQVRAAQTEFFLPRLKERKQIIEAMMQDMRQTFAEHSFSQAKAQSEGAENSLVLARQQLKELVEERLTRLDLVGRNQQTGLEEIFKSAAVPLEQETANVMHLLKQAEQEIKECEEICNKLAETYNLDSDPSLTALRQDVYAKVDSLKSKLRAELERMLDTDCQNLEDTAKNCQTKLTLKRGELVQQVRAASDKGLQTIRQAIHDAYNMVQVQREKYME